MNMYSATGFESKMPCFWCFDLYFVNYRSWQAEILQERAEGCIQVDLQTPSRLKLCIFILWFCRGGFWS